MAGGGQGSEEGGAAANRRRGADRARAYERMAADPCFAALRKRYALQTGALVSVFLLGYLSCLLLSAYARDFMSVRVVDSVNVALAMGLGRFASTFVPALAFGRLPERSLDPLARQLLERARQEEGGEGAGVRGW